MARSSGDISIQAGEYLIDNTTWFDIRLTDAGWCLSLCDMEADIRYTILVDKGSVILAEVKTLLKESMDSP